MKRIMMLVVCVASLVVFAGEYDDYVQHNGGGGDAFVTATAWTPNGIPESGKNYYVPANKTMTVGTSGATSTFGGDKLVVAGAVSFVGSGGTKVYWGDSEFLGGCSMTVWSLCQSYDTWRISGTENTPFTWIFGRSNKDKGQRELVNMHVAMKSVQTGYLKLSSNRGSGSIYGPLLDVSDCDFTEFFGTFRCLPNAFLRSSKVFSFSGALLFDGGEDTYFDLTSTVGGSSIGKLSLGENMKMELAASSGTTTFGDLSIGQGTTISLTSSGNTHVISVTNRLQVAAGAKISSNKSMSSAPKATAPDQQPSEMKFFVFSAEAVRNGLSTANLEQAIEGNYITAAKSLTLPRAKFNWADAADGGKTLALSYRRYVQMVDNNGNKAFKRSADPTIAWSDGQYPVPGTDYYSQTGTMINPDAADLTDGVYVFPGEHLAFDYHTGLYAQRTKVNFIAYGRHFSEGNPHPRFRTFFTGQTICLDGTIEVVPNGQYRTCYFQVGDRNTLVIGSSLLGAGDILFYLGMETQTADRTYWNGGAELTGDNRAFTGKMMLAIQDYGLSNFPDGAAAFVPSAVSNVTLTVHGPKNLGGTLPAFTYDALCVSNQNRLVLADTATYDETTRGWFFPETAYLGVKPNAVAKVLNTVTVGGELVKEDTGSVMFAALAQENDADAKKITVRGGSVGALTTTALDGVPLAFVAGAGLIVEAYPTDQTFAAKGFTYTDVSKLTSAETIPVTIAGVADWTVDFVPFTVGICTVPTAQAATLAGKMRAKKPAKGIGAKIVTIDNGDGTTTIAANCDKFGLAIVVR